MQTSPSAISTRAIPSRATSTRAAALTAGAGLAAMAVLAPLGVMVALHAGHLEVAALVVLVVAALDIVVSIALFPVLRAGGELLAHTSVAMRLVYAAVFATAAGDLARGEVDGFQTTWDAGLLIFGLHLLLTGVAAIRASGIPSWVGVILLLAGAGYVFDAVATLLAAGQTLSVGEFTFIGEVVLLIWLLGWGGRTRPRLNQTRSTPGFVTETR